MPITRAFHLFQRANANKGRVVRALGRAGRHGFWAMADQGVASLGSFGIFFLLGREFAQRDAMARDRATSACSSSGCGSSTACRARWSSTR